MMRILAYLLIGLPVGFLLYSYLMYPLLLKGLGVFKAVPTAPGDRPDWPSLTIIVPSFNEERSIAATLESLLALDYPDDKRQIVVISDASTDRTDEIVRSFASRGVELLRLPVRTGKTAAENAATPYLRGEIIVHTDATIRIVPGALKMLIAQFQDPTVGVASGRDVSVGDIRTGEDSGESGYVGYEMTVRSLETRIGTIVGASGCFFADRSTLHDSNFPERLSRDFASCLIAREQGYRSVSVDGALALVPRASALRSEYRRKIRTMTRGLATLHFKRHLLNPFVYGSFSWMLFSHKLARWLFQLTVPLGVLGVVVLAVDSPGIVPWLACVGAALIGIAIAAYRWPADKPMPGWLSAPGYFIWSNVAGVVAWARFLAGKQQAVWEPTRRNH